MTPLFPRDFLKPGLQVSLVGSKPRLTPHQPLLLRARPCRNRNVLSVPCLGLLVAFGKVLPLLVLASLHVRRAKSEGRFARGRGVGWGWRGRVGLCHLATLCADGVVCGNFPTSLVGPLSRGQNAGDIWLGTNRAEKARHVDGVLHWASRLGHLSPQGRACQLMVTNRLYR